MDAAGGEVTTSGSSDISHSSESERSQPIPNNTQPTRYQASEIFLNALDRRDRELDEQNNFPRIVVRPPLRNMDGEAMSISLTLDADNIMGSLDLDYMLIPLDESVSVSRTLGLPTIMRRDASPMPYINTHVQTSTSSGGCVNGILWGCSSFICQFFPTSLAPFSCLTSPAG